MFGKKSKAKDSIADKIERGDITIEKAQSLLNIRQLELLVNDTEHAARDHSNLTDLRQSWGKVILGVLLVTIAGDMFLIGMVGSNIWTFEGNTYFLNVVVTEHLVQILGLVLVVLKSLFPNNKDT
jgi:hypothetical protein